MDKVLKTKARDLIDRQEIWAVVLRYTRGIDRLDRTMVRSCYWDDAIDDHHAYVGGPDFFVDTTCAGARATSIVQHYGVCNYSCEIVGYNAHGETYYTFIGANIEPP